MKKVLILCFSNLDRDPRVKRQYNYFINMGFEVFLMGYNNIEGAPNFIQVKISKSKIKKLLNHAFITAHQYALAEKINLNRFDYNKTQLENIDFDLIVANDLQSVSLAKEIAGEHTRIWVDLHEYTPLEMEHNRYWKMVYSPYHSWQARTILPDTDVITTVTKGLAEGYEKNFDLEVDEILFNSPQRKDYLSPQKVDPNNIKFVHHGVALPARGLEVIIQMMQELNDTYQLHLYLMAINSKQIAYLNKLKTMAEKVKTKIFFHQIVPTNKIPDELNQYDAQLMFVAPVNFNYIHGLGNKFFESIQARIAVISGPLESKSYYINKYEIGMSTSSFDPKIMAEEIQELSVEELQEYKNNTQKVYKELSVEGNYKKMDTILKEKLNWNI